MQSGQLGPILSTSCLSNKHQLPGLFQGQIPKLVLDSAFLLLISAASLLTYISLIMILAFLLSLDWHSALELVLHLAIKDNESCNPSSPSSLEREPDMSAGHPKDITVKGTLSVYSVTGGLAPESKLLIPVSIFLS